MADSPKPRDKLKQIVLGILTRNPRPYLDVMTDFEFEAEVADPDQFGVFVTELIVAGLVRATMRPEGQPPPCPKWRDCGPVASLIEELWLTEAGLASLGLTNDPPSPHHPGQAG